MAETLTLAQILDAVVMQAGIDGQTSTGGRHSTSRLTDLFNRYWSSLRSLVSGAGHTEFLAETSAAAIPAATSGEDYIVVTWPIGASEIHGVDVKVSTCWETLSPIRFPLRRVVSQSGEPSWAVKKLPKENTTTVTDGEIALFPPRMSGLYKIWYLEHWTPIATANQTYVVVGYPDWFTWVILSMSEVVAGRDNNKKGMLLEWSRLKREAEERIMAAARRVQRAGPIVPRRRDGIEL